MEPLQGAERLILQTIHDLNGGVVGPVEDQEITRKCNIPRHDVNNWFLTLQEKGYVNIIVTSDGRSAEITPKGIQLLRQLEQTFAPTTSSSKIVFKGLRAFGKEDAGFFLELLPGSRGPDGLPECVRFWKYKIEESDSDKTFQVGLIYGPSGCGKSSLMEAGIIPNLDDSVIPIYVQATANETEFRLLNALRRYCPFLPHGSPLFSTLQGKQDIPAGKKVMIVLDQFEQWLHAKFDTENSELLLALKECDGEKVQCVLMVRDDFWTPVSRFLKQLGVEQQEGKNIQMIDFFEHRHAKNVLVAFGKSLGRLGTSGNLTNEQSGFLDAALSTLVEERKFTCIALVLFTELVKDETWEKSTLAGIGSFQEIGLTFLKAHFVSENAPQRQRKHKNAAEAVLAFLLPEQGTTIKGAMKTEESLRQASGYAHRKDDWDELLRILDLELRLITETRQGPQVLVERDVSGLSGEQEVLQAKQKVYQLTHDLCVTSVREWVCEAKDLETEKQKRSWRGRAELLLRDYSGWWAVRPDNSQLPSLLQWLNIWWLTQKNNWNAQERSLMQKASQFYFIRVGSVFLVTALMIFIVWYAIAIHRIPYSHSQVEMNVLPGFGALFGQKGEFEGEEEMMLMLVNAVHREANFGLGAEVYFNIHVSAPFDNHYQDFRARLDYDEGKYKVLGSITLLVNPQSRTYRLARADRLRKSFFVPQANPGEKLVVILSYTIQRVGVEQPVVRVMVLLDNKSM
jgi:predicted transcriptional regulator